MFGKKTTETKKENIAIKKELAAVKKAAADATPDLVVDKPIENAGMPGFTVDAKPEVATATEVTPIKDEGIPGFGSIGAPVEPPVEELIAAPAIETVKAPEVSSLSEHYQIVETGMATGEGLYVYKIVTNKYLGELGGVYEA